MNKTIDDKKLVKLVEYKIKDVLLNLIYDLADNPASKAEYIVPQSVLDIRSELERAYIDFSDALETTDRKDYEERLVSLTDDIINSALNINRYVLHNDALGERLLRDFKFKDIEKMDMDIPLNNGRVSEVIREYVYGLEDSFENSFAMAELISVLPLRMTRDRYTDYIKRGVKLLTADLPEEFANSSIERLKDMFYTECEEDFKKDFPLMYEKLKATEESIQELDRDGITEALSDIDGNGEALEEIYGILGMYYNNAVYLQILSMFAVDSDFLFNDDMILKDLYYSLRDSLSTNDNTFIEEILERSGNEISDRFDVSKPIEEELIPAINALTPEEFESLSDDTRIALNVSNSISNMYYSELDEQLMLLRGTESDVDKMTAELIEYINAKTQGMSNSDKKLLKQSFLKHIPCPMTKEELCTYSSYALDGINDKNISLVTYGDIFHITDSSEEHEHEHHHNHDCGHERHHDCGHDHGHAHHHHGCGCGHEH